MMATSNFARRGSRDVFSVVNERLLSSDLPSAVASPDVTYISSILIKLSAELESHNKQEKKRTSVIIVELLAISKKRHQMIIYPITANTDLRFLRLRMKPHGESVLRTISFASQS